VSDCFTGAVLSVTDPNGAKTCTQYDNLGRLIETAGPGDSLSAPPGGVRDGACPSTGNGQVGSGGNGPTTWVEYLFSPPHSPVNTISHIKDGKANGHYIKKFVDGIGRPIQTCTEIDPNASAVSPGVPASGNETCTYAVYDELNRVKQQYLPYFASSGSVARCVRTTATPTPHASNIWLAGASLRRSRPTRVASSLAPWRICWGTPSAWSSRTIAGCAAAGSA
jgi:YD repeat-containing protein